MTEDQAVTTDCCGPSPCGKVYQGRRVCVASACMAWRWKTVPNPAWQPPTMATMMPQTNPYSTAPSGIDSTTDGGCGLAGAPR